MPTNSGKGYGKKNGNKNSLRSGGLFVNLFKKDVLVAFIFVLVIGGIGGYFIAKSNAEPICAHGNEGTFTGDDDSCVGSLQFTLNKWHSRTAPANPYKVSWLLAEDDDYGAQTQDAVKDFQTWANNVYCGSYRIDHTCYSGPISTPLAVDGEAGENTDYVLCWAAQEYNFKFDDFGCIRANIP